MKRLALFLGISLVAGAFLFQQAAERGGYVLISLGNTSVEMSFWTALLALLVTAALLFLLVRFVRGLWRLPARAGALTSSARRARRHTARGLENYIEGNWKQARQQLLKGAPQSDQPLINYLGAARSSYHLGRQDEAFELIHRAEKLSSNDGLAVSLTQARMLLAAGQYEQCLANLERARKKAPKHPVVLDLLRQVYVKLEDWESLRKLLPELRRQKVLAPERLEVLEYRLYAALLANAADQTRAGAPSQAVTALEKVWDKLPGAWRRNGELPVVYAQKLLELGAHGRLERFLRSQLKQNWREELVALYGRVRSDDIRRQLLTAEHWQQERPGSASLLLTLGRLCLRDRQWQRARDYFESSLKLRKDPETCAELARLLAHLGEHKQSTGYYQHGLLMATEPLPDLPMPELEGVGQSAAEPATPGSEPGLEEGDSLGRPSQ